jgi:hypothetical protein
VLKLEAIPSMIGLNVSVDELRAAFTLLAEDNISISLAIGFCKVVFNFINNSLSTVPGPISTSG